MIDEFHGGSLQPEEPKEPEKKSSAENAEPIEPTPHIDPNQLSAPEPIPYSVTPPQPLPPEPEPLIAAEPEPVNLPPEPTPLVELEATPPAASPEVSLPEPPAPPAPVMETELPPEPEPLVAMEEEAPSPPPLPPEPTPLVEEAPLPPEPQPLIEAEAPLPPEPEPLIDIESLPPESEPLLAQPPAEEEPTQLSQEQEGEIEESAFEAAMQLVAKGMGVEQILGTELFTQLPEHLKQKLRARLQEVAIAEQQKQHEMAKQTREQAESKGFGFAKLFSLSAISNLISKDTLDKINALFAQQPHLQQQIQLQGQNLIRAGATPDLEFAKSNVQVVSAAPVLGAPSQEQQQTPQL